jgi:hypothetical protein
MNASGGDGARPPVPPGTNGKKCALSLRVGTSNRMVEANMLEGYLMSQNQNPNQSPNDKPDQQQQGGQQKPGQQQQQERPGQGGQQGDAGQKNQNR